MKYLLFLILFLTFNAHAQKLFGLFGSDEKKSTSEKMSTEIEDLLDNAKKSKDENSLNDLDKVMDLIRKQTQVKIIECKNQDSNKDKNSNLCFSDLIEFQERSIDRLYDIRKQFLVNHHARILEELELTRVKHRETVRQAFQKP